MKASRFGIFTTLHMIVWALILFSSVDIRADINAEIDEMRIIPRTPIEKIPGPMRFADYLINQLPEDKKGLESLSEGIKKGDSIFQYGNWYGPGWWGGGTDEDEPGNMEPVDELDAAAQRHDFGYLVAEKMGKVYGKAEEYRLKAIADAIAVEDARRLDPDPAKWDPPAADPEKASRYRDRIITGFHYESMAYDGADKAGRLHNWVTSPMESWEMSDHEQKLDRSDFERHVKIYTDHWTRTNVSVKEEGDDQQDSTPEQDADSESRLEDDSPLADDRTDDSAEKKTKDASDDGDPKTDDGKDDSSVDKSGDGPPAPKGASDSAPSAADDDPSDPGSGDDGSQTNRDEQKPEGKDDSDGDDDGLIHGPPSGDESNLYDEGTLIIDDDGVEYEKGPDGSWTETGDKYDPLAKEQKDAWDRELEDDAGKLKDQEASSGGSFDGSDDSSGSDENIIDSYADNYQEKQKKKNDISADNMDLNQQIKNSSTSGDQQIYDAKKIVSSAGRDAKDIKDASSAKTAQKERDDSWGNTLGDAVGDGVQKGLEDFASTFGNEAADAAAAQIFDGDKKKKPIPSGAAIAGVAPGSGGGGGAVPQPGGGQGSGGGGSGGAPAGGGGAPAAGGGQDGSGADGDGVAADGAGLADELANEAGTMPADGGDDFDKSGDSVTVKEEASAGDGGGTANTGSSASGGFAKGHQDRVINGSGALGGKTVTGVTVKLTYQAYAIPDSFAIIYEGKSLGGSGMTSGRGTISGKSAGSSSSVTIRVLSNQDKKTTKWNWSAEVTFHTK